MSKHTPEPWKISHDDSTEEWSIVTNQRGSIIANVNEETGPELVGSVPVMRKMPGLENARRIVACVNACSGIRTEALEHRAHMLKAHDDTIAELKRQRDELFDEFKQLMKFYGVDSAAELIRAQERHILRLQESSSKKPMAQILAPSPVRSA